MKKILIALRFRDKFFLMLGVSRCILLVSRILGLLGGLSVCGIAVD